MHPEYTSEEIERFWKKVDRSGGPDACWPFMGAHDPTGYGVIRIRQRNLTAHRFVLIITGKLIDPSLDACHSCDNRPCCNPAHLWAGTRGENLRDMMAKGRRSYENHAFGERVGTSKLTADQVREIRRLAPQTKAERQAVADRFGINRHSLNAILRGVSWRHLL